MGTTQKTLSSNCGEMRHSQEESLQQLRSAKPCEDRRITRSKLALKEALIVLMEEQGFDNVTVNDLCVKAGLNRGTFYNHFKTKEDLLWELEDEVLKDLVFFQEEMKKVTLTSLSFYVVSKKPLPFLVALFDYLRLQGDFLHAVLGPGGDIRFGPRLRDLVCMNLIQSILHERYRASSDPLVQYYVSFFASAYLGVIMRWIETGMKEPSEEMARIAMRLLFIRPGESIKM